MATMYNIEHFIIAIYCLVVGFLSDHNHPSTSTAENLYLMRLLDEEYMRHPFLGSRRLREYLGRPGIRSIVNGSSA